MPEYSRLAPSKYIRPLGVLHDDGIATLAGTGFGIHRRGLVLTASHVLGSAIKPGDVFLGTGNGLVRADHIERHPEADLAALIIDSDRAPLCFSLGEPPEGLGDFPLGTEVSSYGFPYRDEPSGRKTLEPRLMRGHIQRHFRHGYHNPRRRFHAIELSFPVSPGQSGSPVFLDHAVRSVIAVVTDNFDSSRVLEVEEEHEEGGDRELHMTSRIISFGIGAVLWRHADWLSAL